MKLRRNCKGSFPFHNTIYAIFFWDIKFKEKEVWPLRAKSWPMAKNNFWLAKKLWGFQSALRSTWIIWIPLSLLPLTSKTKTKTNNNKKHHHTPKQNKTAQNLPPSSNIVNRHCRYCRNQENWEIRYKEQCSPLLVRNKKYYVINHKYSFLWNKRIKSDLLSAFLNQNLHKSRNFCYQLWWWSWNTARENY